ncbi:MAG: hypothetical protein ACP5XB_09780, partial [Isosphaeraceae bacterium]
MARQSRSLEAVTGQGVLALLLGLAVLAASTPRAAGADQVAVHQVVTLWPGGAPGAKGSDPDVDIPTLTVWLPRPE